ncbi:flavin-containing monooxygenase [Virgibacillus sp. DJP39]|uniref:flavin-containing monooxygenase n=1 Tax=Virgibacillus sp. DJP39 TaxID=3409790 RepID=UPI003BB4BDEB
MGYYLKETGLSFTLVDGGKRVGDVWRNRYDSLRLFSPRAYSFLPGMKLLGIQDGFPTKDELADYLENYSNHFSIPIDLNTKVEQLEKIDDQFRVKTNQGDLIANNVVIATGPFQKPFIPEVPGEISTGISQIHSSDYRGPHQISKGPVLVVGGGNSGLQIAAELSNTRKVYVSSGHELVFIPYRILNKSFFWWLKITGLSRVSTNAKLAKVLKKTEPIIGTESKALIDSGQLDLKGRTVSFYGKEVEFQDKTKIQVESIIWATGYQFYFSWVDIPGVFDSLEKPIHQRGISPVEGLYFLGLPWLSRVGSAQLNGIAHDAKYLSNYLKKRRSGSTGR